VGEKKKQNIKKSNDTPVWRSANRRLQENKQCVGSDLKGPGLKGMKRVANKFRPDFTLNKYHGPEKLETSRNYQEEAEGRRHSRDKGYKASLFKLGKET